MDWIDKNLYAVEAKPPENSQPSITNLRHTWFDIEDVRLREMLQALLIDRFQLRFHRETKTGQIYLLEKSGKTLRLRQPEVPSNAPIPFGRDTLIGSRICWRTMVPSQRRHVAVGEV